MCYFILNSSGQQGVIKIQPVTLHAISPIYNHPSSGQGNDKTVSSDPGGQTINENIRENTLTWFLDKEFWWSKKKNEGQAKLSYKIINNDDNDEHGFLQRLHVFCHYLVNPISIYFQ